MNHGRLAQAVDPDGSTGLPDLCWRAGWWLASCVAMMGAVFCLV